MSRGITRRRVLQGLVGGLVFSALVKAEAVSWPAYAYRSAAFSRFLEDSYALAPALTPPFRAWLETRYQQRFGVPLPVALRERRVLLQRGGADAARKTALWLHRTVKAVIPRFSLERGFEFFNAVRLGERQCLLQSVLIAGLLQEVGLEAGVVMVWRNPQGQESNLGHATALLRLPDGAQVLVDASEPTPFTPHQGLYLWDALDRSYRFVEARFDDQGQVQAYTRLDNGRPLPFAQAFPMDVAFLRSQFSYYRGERAPGGFLGPSTPEGLATSARFLEQAVQLQPKNPLAVYVLGHVYRKQGRLEAAKQQFRQGYQLYQAQGHLPPGPQQALAWALS